MTTAGESAIEEKIQRSKLYWNVDGIPEIVMGGFWMVWASAVFLPIVIPSRGAVRMQAPILVLGMLAMAVLMPRLIRGWKSRVTFPRSGYVEPRKPTLVFRIAWGLIGAAAGFVFSKLMFSHIKDWLPMVLGLAMAAALVQLAWKVRSARLAWFSCLLMVSAILATALRLGSELGTGVILMTAGAILVADGLLTMRSYLRAHPAGEQQ